MEVEELEQRFHLDHVVMVGDRDIITQARITDDMVPRGSRLDQRLARTRDPSAAAKRGVQLTLFDQRDMASITAPEFSGERLIFAATPISP